MSRVARPPVSHANRGRSLELEIEQANAVYRSRGLATVQKVAVPTKVLPDRRGEVKVIRQRSTVDYIGVWQGRGLAFDAKSTRRPHFPMDMLHQHQVDFLRDWQQCGGLSFLLVELLVPAPDVYLVPWPALDRYWCRWQAGGRASIGADEFLDLPKVRPGLLVALHYLDAVEVWLERAKGAWRL